MEYTVAFILVGIFAAVVIVLFVGIFLDLKNRFTVQY